MELNPFTVFFKKKSEMIHKIYKKMSYFLENTKKGVTFATNKTLID